MKITDITEDKIFATLGKGKDPNYKSIEIKNIIVKPFDFGSIKTW